MRLHLHRHVHLVFDGEPDYRGDRDLRNPGSSVLMEWDPGFPSFLSAGKCNRSHPDPDPCGGRNLADDEELDDQRRAGGCGHRRGRDFLYRQIKPVGECPVTDSGKTGSDKGLCQYRVRPSAGHQRHCPVLVADWHIHLFNYADDTEKTLELGGQYVRENKKYI